MSYPSSSFSSTSLSFFLSLSLLRLFTASSYSSNISFLPFFSISLKIKWVYCAYVCVLTSEGVSTLLPSCGSQGVFCLSLYSLFYSTLIYRPLSGGQWNSEALRRGVKHFLVLALEADSWSWEEADSDCRDRHSLAPSNFLLLSSPATLFPCWHSRQDCLSITQC